MTRKYFAAIGALTLLAACTATTQGYSFLKTENANRDYRRMTIHMNDGAKPVVYLKTFDHGGKLGLCGYYTEITGTDETFFCSWLKQAAHVEIKGQKITSAGFLIYSDEDKGPYSGRAFCVTTNVPYSVDLAYSRPAIRGFAVDVEDDDC